jgi:predicted dehydrogenase
MLKVAVIGVGSMGKTMPAYSEPSMPSWLPYRYQPGVGRMTANRFGVRGYLNYMELLEKERPEAVSIAVPTALHEEVALAALEAGAHILVEKPIAATVEEGRRLIERANVLNRSLMVGHIVRFNPAIQALKQRLLAGDLGRIFQIICRRVGPFPARIRDVGVVVDLAPHDLI